MTGKWTKIKLFNKKEMFVSSIDEGLGKELAKYKIREPFSSRYISSFLSNTDKVLEIGANQGYYTILESEIADQIVAVEPVKYNFSILQKNVKLHKLEKKVKIFKLAIGDKNKKIKIKIPKKLNLSGFAIPKRDILEEEIVFMQTLDNFCLKNSYLPTFIRMDVEGYEYEILKTSKKIVGNENIKLKLHIEFHPHILKYNKSKELLTFLKNNNFKIKLLIFEPPLFVFSRKILYCLYKTYLELFFERTYGPSPFHLKWEDILSDLNLLSGKKGAFHIFLERS